MSENIAQPNTNCDMYLPQSMPAMQANNWDVGMNN